jgi:hypothetical protein
MRMQVTFESLHRRGTKIPQDVIRHIGPARHFNINFRGTFRFPLEKYGLHFWGTHRENKARISGQFCEVALNLFAAFQPELSCLSFSTADNNC